MTMIQNKRLQITLAALISILPLIILWIYAESFVIILLWLFFLPFFISIISGILRGLLFRNWSTFKFALQIFAGNFITEENSTLKKGIKIIVSRIVWEQPQTMIGNFSIHLLNIVWLIHKIDKWKRALVCQGVFLNGGGIAFGSFIMIDLKDSNVIDIFPMDDRTVPEKILIRHEYGHTLQSVDSGPLFILKYGLPSIIMQGWTEADADYRSDNELFSTEQILPVFSNIHHYKAYIKPHWWEHAIPIVLLISGWMLNELSGLFASLVISSILITVINLKKPA